jgi:hypothetical protein
MAGGHNTSPSPSHTQALASSSFRTKTTDEEELLSNMGGKKMPNPEEDRHANRSEKSSFKPVESDQFQIGPRKLIKKAVKNGNLSGFHISAG